MKAKYAMSLFMVVLTAMIGTSCQDTSEPLSFAIEEKTTTQDVLFIAISLLDDEALWISGTQSTFIQTTDGGDNWSTFHHPQVDTFQFRDIHAFDRNRVVLLASGEGANSQIHLFSKDDGWQTSFVMDHDEGFLNSISFWNDEEGLAYGDAFDGKPYVLRTLDGGRSWTRVEGAALPDALPGEGGFASSGSCIEVAKGGRAWIGTGAGSSSRVLKTSNYGESWEAFESPIVKGDLAGITSIHFRSRSNGFIAGGDLSVSDEYSENVAFTSDAGETWNLASQPITKGAFYGGDFIRYKRRDIAIVCGPNGADITFDRGNSWINLLSDNLWVVDLHPSGIGWFAGREGKVYKLRFL